MELYGFLQLLKLFGLGIAAENAGGVVPVHVAEGDDVLRLHLAEVGEALAADADAGDVELLAGGRGAAEAEDVGLDREEGGRCAGAASEEPAARKRMG